VTEVERKEWRGSVPDYITEFCVWGGERKAYINEC